MFRLPQSRHLAVLSRRSRSRVSSSVLSRSYRTAATAPPPSAVAFPASPSEEKMRFCRPDQVAPFFILTTAVVFSFRPFSTTQAENRQTLPPHPGRDRSKCPSYGCPLTPQDVHYNNETVKTALENVRSLKREDTTDETMQALEQSATTDASAVTLTLIGYKGGQLQEQINQDRSIVVSPYYIGSDKKGDACLDQDRILIGVFDGHAPLGEL